MLLNIHPQVGPRLVAVLGEVKPAVKALLEAEYGRVGYDPSALKTAAAAAGGGAGGSGGSGSCGLPRQDLFGPGMLDKGQIVAELTLTEGKTSWQNRKNAIEVTHLSCACCIIYTPRH